jgi:hypothetical protein
MNETVLQMFVTRLNNMQKNGDRWITIEAALAMMGDCQMIGRNLKRFVIETHRGRSRIISAHNEEVGFDTAKEALDLMVNRIMSKSDYWVRDTETGAVYRLPRRHKLWSDD